MPARPTPSALARYAEGYVERGREAAEQARAWRRDLEPHLAEAADCLVRRFRVSRVLLFGSVARGDAEPGSDVDLLVTGLPPQRLFEAAAAAQRLLPMADVDLVPIELARPEVVVRAECEGRLLYGTP